MYTISSLYKRKLKQEEGSLRGLVPELLGEDDQASTTLRLGWAEGQVLSASRVFLLTSNAHLFILSTHTQVSSGVLSCSGPSQHHAFPRELGWQGGWYSGQ